MTTVEERTSECGFKEDLDRKEFEYQSQIDHLRSNITDIECIIDLTRSEIANIQTQNLELEQNKKILEDKEAENERLRETDDKLN